MKILVLIISLFAVSSFSADSTFVLELRKKMEAGDVDSQIELAKIYNHGKGIVRSDLEESERLLRPLAEKGNAKAQLHLGYLYNPENGRLHDYTHRRTKQKCDSLTNEIALFVRRLFLSDSLFVGSAIKSTIETEREEWILKDYARFPLPKTYGHRVGPYLADSVFDRIYDSISSEMNSERWFFRAAEQGLPEAQCELAVHSMYGWCKHVGMGEQIYWLEKAAEQNYVHAQYLLGQNYLYYFPEYRDYARSYFWLMLVYESCAYEVAYELEELKGKMENSEFTEAQKLLDEWHSRKDK